MWYCRPSSLEKKTVISARKLKYRGSRFQNIHHRIFDSLYFPFQCLYREFWNSALHVWYAPCPFPLCTCHPQPSRSYNGYHYPKCNFQGRIKTFVSQRKLVAHALFILNYQNVFSCPRYLFAMHRVRESSCTLLDNMVNFVMVHTN